MSRSAIPVLLPIVPLVAAVLAALAGEWRAGAARAVAGIATVAMAGAAVVGLVLALDGDPLRHQLGGWAAPFGIEYALDALSGYMAVVVAFVGLVVVAYPTRTGFSIAPRRRVPLYPLVLLLLAGLMGVVVTADLFNLFVFLEIFAIASYALVALGGPRATVASLRYLLFGTIGSGFYLLGVGYLYFTTGSLSMGAISVQLQDLHGRPAVVVGLALIVIGLALKMALFPLHVWLPEAHSYAPPAVAALLAGVQVKVAAYALIRILLDMFGLDWVSAEVPVTELLVWAGVAGVLFGSVAAIRQRDLKRMLAYSTVAQLGFLGIGIGLASRAALVAALFQVLNHAAMKSCLFLVAGGISSRTGIREIPRMAGLARHMPVSAATLTVASLAMVGIPPTTGFFAKWYLLVAALDEHAVIVAVIIAASSLLTLGYVLRVIQTIYARPEHVDQALEGAREAPAEALAPALGLAAVVIVAGVANAALVTHVLAPIAEAVLPQA